jgi:acetyl-CoA C-acetyltransferase
MYKIGREEQDRYAVESHQRWAKAQKAGAFEGELVPLADLERDEHPRPETTVEKLGTLRAAFKEEGTVTPGNASGINDGAAMLVVSDEETARRNGWDPLAAMFASASVGLEPSLMGLGPVHATRNLCEESGCRLEDFETVEINEAFAAQTLACIQELSLDPGKVNPEGGAIAMGHPIGASGARLITHVAHRIAAGEIERGLATLCVGGGMGAAVALEKV